LSVFSSLSANRIFPEVGSLLLGVFQRAHRKVMNVLLRLEYILNADGEGQQFFLKILYCNISKMLLSLEAHHPLFLLMAFSPKNRS
jgi:hypothetical protein